VTSSHIHSGSHLKKYLQHTPWYLLSSIATKAIYFFLLPVYTKYIPPEEYGIYSNLEAFGKLLPMFISLYMDASFGRYYYLEKKQSENNISKLYSTYFWFLIVWGGLFSLGITAAAPYLFDDLIDVPLWPIVILVITQLLTQLGVMVTLIWRANLFAKRLAILQLVMSLCGIGVSLYLLIILEMSWQSPIYGMGIVALLQTTLLLFFAYKQGWIKFVFDWSILRRGLIYSIPLLPNVAAGWIAGFSDRIILTYYGRIDEAGLYAIAVQIAFILYVLNDAITQVQGPLAMSGLTDNVKEAKKKIEQFIVVFFSGMSVVYIALSLFSYEIVYLFTDSRYHDAWKLIPILGYLYVISGIYRIFSNILSFHGKTWVISSAAIIQAGINIALNFIFIPQYGMYGAAISSLVSLLGYTFWIIWWSQKTDAIRIPWKDFSYIFILTSIATSLLFILHTEAISAQDVILKLVIIVLFAALLFRLCAVRKIIYQVVNTVRR